MRKTNSFTTAMHRLADAMGWCVKSTGGSWKVTLCPHPLGLGDTPGFEGLSYSSLAMFALMVRVAHSSLAYGGLGWTFDHIRDVVRIRMARTYQGDLMLPANAAASDEATIYRLMKGADDASTE